MNNSTEYPSIQEGAEASDTPKYWDRVRAIMASDRAPIERLILIAIADHVGSDGRCWPSTSRLASMAGIKRPSASRIIKRLLLDGVLTVQRRSGRSTVYEIQWKQLSTCHRGLHPLSPRVTPPVTEGYTPCHSGLHEDTKKTEEKTTKKKARSKSRALSLDEVRAIPIPIDLQALDGYSERFSEWLDVRKGSKWRQTATQITRFHEKMAAAHSAGLDVLAGLDRAYEGGYQGLNASWLKPRASQPQPQPQPQAEERLPGAPSQQWERLQDALLHFGQLPPGLPADHPKHWAFSRDGAVERAYHRAICAAAQEADLTLAWRLLWQGGKEKDVKWQRIRFDNEYRRSMRGVA